MSEAATLLNVNERTIRRWIDAEWIPYLELPGGSYRIPQGALLASLSGNYDLAAERRDSTSATPSSPTRRYKPLSQTNSLNDRRCA